MPNTKNEKEILENQQETPVEQNNAPQAPEERPYQYAYQVIRYVDGHTDIIPLEDDRCIEVPDVKTILADIKRVHQQAKDQEMYEMIKSAVKEVLAEQKPKSIRL